jgi:hypothetical protein
MRICAANIISDASIGRHDAGRGLWEIKSQLPRMFILTTGSAKSKLQRRPSMVPVQSPESIYSAFGEEVFHPYP